MTGRGLFARVRGAAIGVFVPIHFAITSGHFRSAISGKPVDYAGRPVPWYTLPAIDFLSMVDFGEASVLEFGGGHSTLWWGERAQRVLTLETDPQWHAYLEERTESMPNVECVLVSDDDAYVAYPRGDTFDVVVIDGDVRARCAETAVEVVRDDGIVIVDDSEGYWGRPGTYPIVDHLQSHGFARVDFYGYPPGVRRPHSTSLFFRNGARAFRGLSAPTRPYVV